jgi:hypothetical protein
MDNLLQTLHFLTENHIEVVRESQLVTICQDSCMSSHPSLGEQFWSLTRPFKGTSHRNLNLPYMQLPYVTNLAVGMCVSDKIIVLESDRILPKGYFAEVVPAIEPGVQITTKLILKLKAPATNDEISQEKFEYFEDRRSQKNEIGCRNMWSGNTAFHKTDFYACGEMDTAYKGYGWADSDMTNRMEQHGVQSMFRDEVELHLWHPPTSYGTGDQKQMFIDNGLRFCKVWNTTLPDWFRQEIAVHKRVLL